MSDIFDLRAMVSADVSPFNTAMDKSADSVSASLSIMNTAATAFIGNGFIRTFIKATNTAYKFGQVMADISSISEVNTKKLADQIRGLDNVYGKLSNVGNTIYETISSGFDESIDNLINFQKIVKQASTSIRADIETTGSVMTTLLNAYGMQLSEASRLADMLYVTVREGKAQGNELARTLGLVTNTAAEAGVELSELSAVISILSRTQSTSQTMIAFNQMLNALIKPTQEATREAKRWGIEIGADALRTKGFTAILTEMHDKVGGNVNAINALLGNIRAMRAGTALTGRQFKNFVDALHEAQSEIGSGVAYKAFEKQTQTAQQQLENFGVSIDKTFEQIGKDLEPISKFLLGVGEGISEGFRDSHVLTRWTGYLTILGYTIKTVKRMVDSLVLSLNSLNAANARGVVHNVYGRIQETLKASINEYHNVIKGIDADAKTEITASRNSYIKKDSAVVEAYQSRTDQSNAVIAEYRRRMQAEREIIAGLHESIAKRKEAFNTEIRERNKHISELTATQTADIARRKALSHMDYVGSGALLASEFNTLTLKSAGSRSMYNQQILKSRADAVDAWTSMATGPDIEKVIAKKLNPTADAIKAMALSNVENMYHTRRGKSGELLQFGINPATGEEIDIHKELTKEQDRLAISFRSAKAMNEEFMKTQAKGLAKYQEDMESLDNAISARKQLIETLQKEKSDIQAEFKRLDDVDKQKLGASKYRLNEADAGVRTEQEAQRVDAVATKARRKELKNLQEIEAEDIKQRAAVSKLMVATNKRLEKEMSELQSLMNQQEAKRQMLRKQIETGGLADDDMSALMYSGTARTDVIGGDKTLRRRLAKERLKRAKGEGLYKHGATLETYASSGLYLNKGGKAGRVYYNAVGKLGKIATSTVSKFALIDRGLGALGRFLGPAGLIYTTWTMAYDIGKSIGEKLKLADSGIFKWIGAVTTGTNTSKQQEENDRNDLDMMKMRLNRSMKKADSLGLLSKADIYNIEVKMLDATKADDLLATVKSIDSKIKDAEKPKEDTPTLDEDIAAYHDARKNAKPNLSVKGMKEADAAARAEFKNIEPFVQNSMEFAKAMRSADASKYLADLETQIKEYDTKKLDDAQQFAIRSGAFIDGQIDQKTLDTLTERAVKDNVEKQKKALDAVARLRSMNFEKEDLKDAQERVGASKLKRAIENFQNRINNTIGVEPVISAEEEHRLLSIANGNFDAYMQLKDTYTKNIRKSAADRSAQDFSKANAEMQELLKLPLTKAQRSTVQDAVATAANRMRIPLDVADSIIKDSLDTIDYEQAYLKGKGYTAGSKKLADGIMSAIDKEIENASEALENSTTKRTKSKYAVHITELYDKQREVATERINARSELRGRKVDAGMMSEYTAAYLNSRDLIAERDRIQAIVNSLKGKVDKGDTSESTQVRLRKAQEQLTDATIKSRIALKELGDTTSKYQSSLFSSIQGFMRKDKPSDRAGNNQIYHSINLLSRMVGPGIVRAGGPNVNVRGGVRHGQVQSRAKAEQQVLAALDSYIMSQKYAEANIGKTVVNIYDFMRNNNTITVSR